MADKLYSDDDVRQILSLALYDKAEGYGISRDEMLQMAAELNVSPQEVARAEEKFKERQQEKAREQVVIDLRKQFEIEHKAEVAKRIIILTILTISYFLFFGWIQSIAIFSAMVLLAMFIRFVYLVASRFVPILKEHAFGQWIARRERRERLRMRIQSRAESS